MEGQVTWSWGTPRNKEGQTSRQRRRMFERQGTLRKEGDSQRTKREESQMKGPQIQKAKEPSTNGVRESRHVQRNVMRKTHAEISEYTQRRGGGARGETKRKLTWR